MSLVAPLACLLLLGAGCASQTSDADPTAVSPASKTPVQPTTSVTLTSPGVLPPEQIEGKHIRLSTTKGDIVFELYPDTAPLAVSNFVYLTQQGFYNNLMFHRREEGFVIQGGDPLSKNLQPGARGLGTGGPGYRFADELKDSYRYERGVVAMANSGANTNGSQFFIMLSDYPLPKSYTIFGRVVEGMDVVDAIQVGDRMTTVTVEEAK